MEIIGDKKNCQISNLTTLTDGPSMFQHGRKIILCGGYGQNDNRCLQFKNGKWSYFNSLKHYRQYSTIVSMKNSVYLIGGEGSPTTSEILSFNETVWKNGPTVPDRSISNACGARISEDKLLIIGGFSDSELGSTQILMLNTYDNTWQNEDLIFLEHGRYDHACVVYNDKIIITGGSGNDAALISTEIVEQVGSNLTIRKGGSLRHKRTQHGMGIIYYNGVPTLIAFGGFQDVTFAPVKTLEMWNDDSETWDIARDIKMEFPRSHAGYVTLPRELLCS